MQDRIKSIQQEYLEKISTAQTLEELDEIFLALFGKNGVVTLLPKDFPNLQKDELKEIGPLFNQTKNALEKAIEERRDQVKEASYKKLESETLDLSPVEIKERKGYLHPLTKFEKEIADLFAKIGFQQYDAPHIDTDYNNFQVLNIPEDHPARDLQDTFYILRNQNSSSASEIYLASSAYLDIKSDNKDNYVLRTHTSNSQVRIMRQFPTPLRFMDIGRCFRYENLDPRHEHTFDQFEIVLVDKGINMANLQYLSEYFLKNVFGNDTKVRLRPKYYPFVEPGAGVDGECLFCKGKGCKVCSGVGWLELAGAGMIHPVVLENGGIDPNEYSGIAWGFSPLRVLMLQKGINDIREFLSGDLEFLQKD